MCINQY